MAIESNVPHGVAAIWRFPATVADLVRFVRVILKTHRATNELNDLSDRYLRDIGVHRPEIAETVRREIARNSLLDAGWPRQPRRSRLTTSTVRRDRRGKSRAITAWVTATQPCVGVKPGCARWKKMALPRPRRRCVMFQSSTMQAS